MGQISGVIINLKKLIKMRHNSFQSFTNPEVNKKIMELDPYGSSGKLSKSRFKVRMPRCSL